MSRTCSSSSGRDGAGCDYLGARGARGDREGGAADARDRLAGTPQGGRGRRHGGMVAPKHACRASAAILQTTKVCTETCACFMEGQPGMQGGVLSGRGDGLPVLARQVREQMEQRLEALARKLARAQARDAARAKKKGTPPLPRMLPPALPCRTQSPSSLLHSPRAACPSVRFSQVRRTAHILTPALPAAYRALARCFIAPHAACPSVRLSQV